MGTKTECGQGERRFSSLFGNQKSYALIYGLTASSDKFLVQFLSLKKLISAACVASAMFHTQPSYSKTFYGITVPSSGPSTKRYEEVYPKNARKIASYKLSGYEVRGDKAALQSVSYVDFWSSSNSHRRESLDLLYLSNARQVSAMSAFVSYDSCSDGIVEYLKLSDTEAPNLTRLNNSGPFDRRQQSSFDIWCPKESVSVGSFVKSPTDTEMASAVAQFIDFLNGYFFIQTLNADGYKSTYYYSTDGNTQITYTVFDSKETKPSIALTEFTSQILGTPNTEIASINAQQPFLSNHIKELISGTTASSGRHLRSSEPVSVDGNWANDSALISARAAHTAFAQLEARALSGSHDDIVRLANAYRTGDPSAGVERDSKRYFEVIKHAAEGGDAWAQNQVGIAYGHGEGVEANSDLEGFWLEKSAAQGFVRAQENLVIWRNNQIVDAQNADRSRRNDAARASMEQQMLEQTVGLIQQQQAQRERERLDKIQQQQAQAERERAAARERQAATLQEEATTRAFNERRAAALQAQQQQPSQSTAPSTSYGTGGGQTSGSPPPSNRGSSQQDQAEAERQRQIALQQQQLAQQKANPSYRHRIERTQRGYSVFVANQSNFLIQCQVQINGYRWFNGQQQSFTDTRAIVIASGQEADESWDGLSPDGATYRVSGCHGIK